MDTTVKRHFTTIFLNSQNKQLQTLRKNRIMFYIVVILQFGIAPSTAVEVTYFIMTSHQSKSKNHGRKRGYSTFGLMKKNTVVKKSIFDKGMNCMFNYKTRCAR